MYQCSARHNKDDYVDFVDDSLMDQTVPSVQAYPGTMGAYDRTSDPPVMVLDGLYVTKLVVHENGANGNDIFFLGTGELLPCSLLGSPICAA